MTEKPLEHILVKTVESLTNDVIKESDAFTEKLLNLAEKEKVSKMALHASLLNTSIKLSVIYKMNKEQILNYVGTFYDYLKGFKND